MRHIPSQNSEALNTTQTLPASGTHTELSDYIARQHYALPSFKKARKTARRLPTSQNRCVTSVSLPRHSILFQLYLQTLSQPPGSDFVNLCVWRIPWGLSLLLAWRIRFHPTSFASSSGFAVWELDSCRCHASLSCISVLTQTELSLS